MNTFDTNDFMDMSPDVCITPEQRDEYAGCIKTSYEHGYSKGWAYYQMKDKYGAEVARALWDLNVAVALDDRSN